MDYTIRVAKTKALISFAETAKLICVFVFAYAKIRFSHDEANITTWLNINLLVLHFQDTSCRYQLLCGENVTKPLTQVR